MFIFWLENKEFTFCIFIFIFFQKRSGLFLENNPTYQLWKAGYYMVVYFPEEDITILWDKRTTIHIKVGPQWKVGQSKRDANMTLHLPSMVCRNKVMDIFQEIIYIFRFNHLHPSEEQLYQKSTVWYIVLFYLNFQYPVFQSYLGWLYSPPHTTCLWGMFVIQLDSLLQYLPSTFYSIFWIYV